MKKAAKWLAALSLPSFVVTWSVLGLKLLEHDHDIIAKAYLGLDFLMIFSSVCSITSLPIGARMPQRVCCKMQIPENRPL